MERDLALAFGATIARNSKTPTRPLVKHQSPSLVIHLSVEPARSGVRKCIHLFSA